MERVVRTGAIVMSRQPDVKDALITAAPRCYILLATIHLDALGTFQQRCSALGHPASALPALTEAYETRPS
jgi:hypothetical protein